MADERTQEHVDSELTEVETALAAKLAGDSGDPLPGDPPDAEELAAEKEASRRGWVPKELYKGDPGKWKPASRYLEDGARFNKNLQNELADLRAKYDQLEKTGQSFAKYHEEAMKRKDDELKEAINDTKRALREAIRNGDDDLADQLETRKDLLETEQKGVKDQVEEVKKESKVEVRPAMNPVVKDWIEDGNEWFDNDPELRQYAIDVGTEMRNAGETAQGRRMLDLVAQRVRDDFPRRFGKKKEMPNRQNDVETSSTGGGAGTGHTIHDLPAEDLALMKDFISKGWTTKEKFLKNYFSTEKKTHRTS